MSEFIKDPDSTLDYKFDWAPLTNGTGTTDWLSSETIASHTVTSDTGITVDKSSITDSATTVTVWVSGGIAGKRYKVSCKITTNSSPSRTDERTIEIICLNR